MRSNLVATVDHGEANLAERKFLTTRLGEATGHPAAFAVVLIFAIFWLVFAYDSFNLSAIATLAVWLMTLFIQRTTRRDTLAIHAKLDELLRTGEGARGELARLDEREPEEIEKHRNDEAGKLIAESTKRNEGA